MSGESQWNDLRSGGGSQLDRRRFLRGASSALALPVLASLAPRSLAGATTAQGVATTASGAPLRTAFVYFPNGAIPTAWWPTETGEKWGLNHTLKPLESVKSKVQLLGGLDHANAEAGPDGAGDHARGNGVFLTGVRLNKSATDLRAARSIDQEIADRVGAATRFPSLELTCDSIHKSGACDSGYSCAYQFNLSWRTASSPMAPEGNPRLVFERLFGDGNHGKRRSQMKRRRAEQKSVLDFVMEDAHAMQQRLAARDRDKLDEYLTGVRDLETRIQRAEQFGEVADPKMPTPAGIPHAYSEYCDLMFDMVALAFQTDATRVATLLLAHDGSNRPFDDIGVTEGHHDLTHHQNRPEWIQKVSEIDLWYARRFARFLERLEQTKDVDDRSVLDNSMIVYGSGNADANRHTHRNLPVVLAGGGGGALSPGRYVRYGGEPMTNLFLSLADRMGAKDMARFGDSTGRLGNL